MPTISGALAKPCRHTSDTSAILRSMSRRNAPQQVGAPFVIEDRRDKAVAAALGGHDAVSELHATYRGILELLRARLPSHVFEVWIKPLKPGGLDGDELRLYAPREIRGWVRDRFSQAISQAASEATGRQLAVRLLVARTSATSQGGRSMSTAGSRLPVRRSLSR